MPGAPGIELIAAGPIEGAAPPKSRARRQEVPGPHRRVAGSPDADDGLPVRYLQGVRRDAEADRRAYQREYPDVAPKATFVEKKEDSPW